MNPQVVALRQAPEQDPGKSLGTQILSIKDEFLEVLLLVLLAPLTLTTSDRRTACFFQSVKLQNRNCPGFRKQSETVPKHV